MTILLGLLLGALAIAWVSVPLLKPPAEAPPEEEAAGSRLSERRFALYDNIRDLDFEYAMGKLTESDYGEARAEMVQEAAGVLEKMDAVSPDQALELWIEAEVAARRSRRASAATSEIACPSCGRPNPAAARFCDGCGRQMSTSACPGCGAGMRPDARFCGECGKKR